MSTQSGNLRALCAHVDHRAGCGKCDICMAADQVEQLEIKNVELAKQVEMLQSGAIALPSDTTALEALIARAGEVMRERCVYAADNPVWETEDEIRALPGVKLEDLK